MAGGGDDKSGKQKSVVKLYKQGNKLFGKVEKLLPGAEGNKLKVRGYMAFLYRTQTWSRAK